MHLFQLGCNPTQGEIRIGNGDSSDESHQAIFGRAPRRALDQLRLGETFAHHAMHRTPQSFDGPVEPLALENADDIIPAVLGP